METASTTFAPIRRRNDIEKFTWITRRYFVNIKSRIHVEIPRRIDVKIPTRILLSK